MKRIAWFGCFFAMACVAQQPTAFRSDVELVTIPFTALDSQGALVSDLEKEEVQVFDNGQRRVVRSLWRDELPLTLGIIIDASESQEALLTSHRDTAVALLERIMRRGDRAFVVSVNRDVRLWAEISSDAAGVKRQLTSARGERMGQACPGDCGASLLWDAVYETARLKLAGIPGNKALLIMSDGFDSGSAHTVEQAAREVQGADASLYAVHYPVNSSRRIAAALRRLVSLTGGLSFDPPKKGDMEPIALQLERDLRRRYMLSFLPEKVMGGWHDVRVETTRTNVVALGNRRYFQK